MAAIGLFFGSDEGNTENVAYRLQARLGIDAVEVEDIADATSESILQFDNIIFGIPTWDFGQIQSDWEAFWDEVSEMDFTGKTVALFGLGDQFGYGDYFLDAMGMLHDVIIEKGAKVVGYWSVDGYEFDASKALINGNKLFCGLAIDEDQQEEMTSDRLNRWSAQVVSEMRLSIQPEILDD